MKSTPLKHQAPIGYLIHEVARLMKRRFEDEASALGITLPQWRALGQLALNETLSQVQLAQAIDANPMTISGVLDRLEKRGLVERFADPADSRAKLARLTPAGKEICVTARKVGLEMYEAALVGIAPEARETVISALTTMKDNLAGQPTGSQDE